MFNPHLARRRLRAAQHSAQPSASSSTAFSPDSATAPPPGKAPSRASAAAPLRSGKLYPDPLHYSHAWPSMAQFARVLALRYDSVRTRHSYYRHLRLLSEHFAGDPVLVTEEQLRCNAKFKPL